MYQIDDSNAVLVQPALPTDNIGTPGFFTGGNPAASPPVPPTRVRFWWLNMIQQELIAIVQAAGIALVKGTNNQVLAALRILFGGTGSLGTTGWMTLPGGLIVQWGVAATTTGNQNAIGFSTTFPGACFGVVLVEANAGAWGEPPSPRVLGANGANVSGFFASSALVRQSGASIDAGSTTFFFIALGK